VVGSDPFTEIAPGVLVATGVLYTTTTTVVAGPAGSCLVIDPAVTPAEIAGLAAALSARGLRPVAGWSTHPHWDHVLWHASLGDVARYAAPAAAAAAGQRHDRLAAQAQETAPGHDLSLLGKLTPLPAGAIPWAGPAAEVIVHNGHAPGHGAVFLPDSGVLVAGDMCSDIEMPLLDRSAGAGLAEPLEAYRAALSRFAAVAGLRQVVPGHGHVGDADEFRRRLAADFAYLDRLERGEPSGDPRAAQGYAREMHEAQLRYFGR
jgi:hydroxyacylglutathione hydrolase